jgi:SAM-dependent methyltransferase
LCPALQINLSPDKARVLQEVHRVLAPGGEMYFSDVYCDRRLPAEVGGMPGVSLVARSVV